MKRAILAAALACAAPAAIAQTSAWPVMPSAQWRAGKATTDANGAIAVAFAALAAAPAIELSTETRGVACYVASSTASGLSATCYTTTYQTLGGQPTFTAASSVVVHWTAHAPAS